jgi:hypothetical protein
LLEYPLQVVRADSYCGAELGQSVKAVGAFLDVPADLAHHFQPGVRGGMQVRQAAAAGTITLSLGDLRDREEKDLLRLGASAGTRRPAVNAGGAHGINEVPVNAGVSLQDCAPLCFFGEDVGIGLAF